MKKNKRTNGFVFTYNDREYKMILFTVVGSRLYNTQYEKGDNPLDLDYVSDHDYRGVFVDKIDNKLGMLGTIDTIDAKSPELIDQINEALGLELDYDTDLSLYEAKKFVTMAANANPNIMDILFADKESIVCSSADGRKLLDNRDVFISKKIKHSFSGYATAQLKRIRGHNKWIHKFPEADKVIDALRVAVKEYVIDYKWIAYNFSGRVASHVCRVRSNAVPGISVDVFASTYLSEDFDIDKYRRPLLYNYCNFKTLRGDRFYWADDDDFDVFLRDCASMVKYNETKANIFNGGNGILLDDGSFKRENYAPKDDSDFVCQMNIDILNYDKKKTNIKGMWDWKIERNEKRRLLEEAHGFDTKHASHLVRLLHGAVDVLNTGTYTPRLSGDVLKFVRQVRDGGFNYEEVLAFSEDMNKKLDEMYKTSKLPDKVDMEVVNDILLAICNYN